MNKMEKYKIQTIEMEKYKIQTIEMIFILLIGVITILTQPPLPLLGIPFLIIISLRAIFIKLEEKQ